MQQQKMADLKGFPLKNPCLFQKTTKMQHISILPIKELSHNCRLIKQNKNPNRKKNKPSN